MQPVSGFLVLVDSYPIAIMTWKRDIRLLDIAIKRWLRNPHHCADLINRMVAFLIKPDSELSLCWIQSTSPSTDCADRLASLSKFKYKTLGFDVTKFSIDVGLVI